MRFTQLKKILTFSILVFASVSVFGADCNTSGYACMNIDSQIKGSRLPMWGTDSGSANAYVVATVAPLGPALKTGSSFMFVVTHTNTTSSTLNVDSTGVIAVKKFAAGALINLASGDMTLGQVHIFYYDGTVYQCVTCFTSSAGGVTSVTCGTGLTGGTFTTTGTCALDVPVTTANGGTGQTSYAKGDLLCASGSTTLVKLPVGINGQLLTADSTVSCGVSWGGSGGGAGPSGPVQVKSGGHVFNGAQTFAQTLTSSPASGNTLVAIASNWSSNTMATPTISDTCASTWTLRGSTGVSTANSNSEAWMWTATAACSSSDTVTVDFLSGHEGSYSIGLLEYTPRATVDGTTACANVSAPSTGITNTVTTTVTDTLITFAAIPASGDSVMHVSSPAGFATEIHLSGDGLWVFDKGASFGVQAVTDIGTSGAGNPEHACLIALH